MDTYKILTVKERLNCKTVFHLSQPHINLDLAWTALTIADKLFGRL